MALAVMVLFSTSHSADDDGGPRATKVLSANIGTITCIYAFIMVAVFRDSGVHVLLLLLRLLLRELELLLLLLLVPTCRFPHKEPYREHMRYAHRKVHASDLVSCQMVADNR